MKNAPTFLSGCVVGTLVTFTLYLSTAYLTQLTSSSGLYSQLVREGGIYTGVEVTTITSEEGDEMATNSDNSQAPDVFSGVKSWMESTLGGDVGAYTSVVPVSPRNFLLPVAYTVGYNRENASLWVNSTWGQRTDGWAVAVGTKEADITITDEERANKHLLIAEKCRDFDASDGPFIRGEELFCLLTAIHDAYIDKYQWFILVHKSTYVAVNQLVKTLLQFDSSMPMYIGQPDNFNIVQRNTYGLVSHERVCRSNAGIILSRAALKRVVPYLRNCLGTNWSKGLRGSLGSGDVELGKCFSRRLGVTCSQSLQVSWVGRELIISFIRTL